MKRESCKKDWKHVGNIYWTKRNENSQFLYFLHIVLFLLHLFPHIVYLLLKAEKRYVEIKLNKENKYNFQESLFF